MLSKLPDEIKRLISYKCDVNTEQTLRMIDKSYNKIIDIKSFNMSSYIPVDVLKDVIHDFDLNYKILKILVKTNNLEGVKWFKDKWLNIHKKNMDFDDDLLCVAVKSGNIDMLEYLKENGCKISRYAMINAAEQKQLSIMKWLYANECPLHIDVFNQALKHYDILVIKWLLENKCPCDSDTLQYAIHTGNLKLIKVLIKKKCKVNHEVFFEAVKKGNLDILEYIYKFYEKIRFDINEYLSDNEYDIYLYAIKSKNIDVLYWLEKNRYTNIKRQLNLEEAAETGDVNIVKWFVQRGCNIERYTLRGAIISNNIELIQYLLTDRGNTIDYNELNYLKLEHYTVLKWLYKNNYISQDYNDKLKKIAMESGDLEFVKTLVTKSKDLDNDDFVIATKSGSIELLSWLHNINCPKHCNALYVAFKKKNYNIINWLLKHNIKFNTYVIENILVQDPSNILWFEQNNMLNNKFPWKKAFYSVVKNLKFQYIKYIHNKVGSKCLSTESFEYVAQYGNFNLILWFKHVNCPWDEKVFAAASSKYGHNNNVIKWFYENKCPYDNLTLANLTSFNNFDMIKMLYIDDMKLDAVFMKQTIKKLSYNNDLQIINWLLAKKCPLNEDVFECALDKQNIELLNILIKEGCPMPKRIFEFRWKISSSKIESVFKQYGFPWNESYASEMAENGDIDKLKWLYKIKCPFDKNTLKGAVSYGDIDHIKWLISVKCPMHASVFAKAGLKGNKQIIDILYEAKCPYDCQTITNIISNGNWEILKYIRTKNFPWDELTFEAAVKYKKSTIEQLQWLKDQGCPWNRKSIQAALDSERPDIIIWLIHNGCPLKKEKYHNYYSME